MLLQSSVRTPGVRLQDPQEHPGDVSEGKPEGRSKGPESRSGEWVEEPYFGSGSRVSYADHITFFRDVLRPLILF